MFNARIRMLAFVERWNVAPRLHRQSVAEHSYFVTLYASTICDKLDLVEWEALSVLEYALRHDLAEIVTGDSPGPAKRATTDPMKLAEFENSFLETIGEAEAARNVSSRVKSVIKAADTLEAWFWVSLEVARGNVLMRNEMHIARDRCYKAFRILGGVFFMPSVALDMFNSADEEVTRLSGSIELAPRLDTDLEAYAMMPDEEIPF